MQEKFVFLTSASDPEVELICQRLKGARIKYQIKNPPEGAYWSLYGTSYPSTGKEIWVPDTELKKAKELLGLEDKEIFSMSRWRFPLIVKIILFIGLIAWILFIILQNVFGIIL